MALNTRLGVAAQNAMSNALPTLANSGKLRIYDGSQPATPDTAVSGQVLLAEFTLNATSFGASSAGVITAGSISAVTAAASGTATWFRVLQSNGTTALWDGTVGTSGANINLNSVAISSGAQVSITAYTFTTPVQGA